MQLHESAEMYLETIYILTTTQAQVRSIDVAQHLGYSKPSVSRAVNLLKQGGFVTTDEDGFLSLTDDGMHTAKKIFERHTVLHKLLVAMGVSDETAAEDACKIEHVISDESLDAIKRYLNA
jgi:Mn-dependent DtxR family transcriptional regulator